MRNNLLKELRSEWKQNSRFIFGKNRIMQLGLGKTSGDETEPQLHKVSKTRVDSNDKLLFIVTFTWRIVVKATARAMWTAVHRQIQG